MDWSSRNHYNRFMTLYPGLPRWVGTRRINHSGFCWSIHDVVAVASAEPYNHMQAICTLLQKITTPAPSQSDFYGPDAIPDIQPTASKHWRLRVLETTFSKSDSCSWQNTLRSVSRPEFVSDTRCRNCRYAGSQILQGLSNVNKMHKQTELVQDW